MRWGWCCNANWIGINSAFTLSVPANRHLIIHGARYNPTFKEIEIWGIETVLPNKNTITLYNDLTNPQRSSGIGGQSRNGGANGADESDKSQETLEGTWGRNAFYGT